VTKEYQVSSIIQYVVDPLMVGAAVETDMWCCLKCTHTGLQMMYMILWCMGAPSL